MKAWMVLAPALALAACVPADKPPVASRPADSCGAAALQGLVGQPAAAVERMDLAKGTRILRPNMPVTADYRPDRLNIELDAKDRVEKVSCY